MEGEKGHVWERGHHKGREERAMVKEEEQGGPAGRAEVKQLWVSQSFRMGLCGEPAGGHYLGQNAEVPSRKQLNPGSL